MAVRNSSLFSTSLPAFVIFSFMVIASLPEVREYLISIVIYLFPVASEAICISSFEDSLVDCLPVFKQGYLGFVVEFSEFFLWAGY